MRHGSFLLALALSACTADDQVATVRLDLSGCLIPQTADAPGCGDSLKLRFAMTGDGSIPACLAVGPVAGGEGATLALAVSPVDGTMTPRGAAESLPLPGDGSDLAFKLFVLNDANPGRCHPSMFQPDRACDARLPLCLMSTKTVFGAVAPDGALAVTFGPGGEACEFECNDVCPPGDESCVSVCHQADPAAGAAGALEACDARDNDCDGLVDEGCDADEDGFCAAGVPVAEGSDCHGRGPDCDDSSDAINPDARELCDGIDNNCDGRVDEPDALDLPPACVRASGACARSVQRCEGGEWVQECGAREYGDDWDGDFEERCDDTVDNDCDGQVDANDPDCECQPGTPERACSVDLGQCAAGVQQCQPVGGAEGEGEGEGEGEAGGPYVWGPCTGVTRTVEVCDGVDEDCDGEVDEDLAPPAGLDVCPVDGVCGDGGAEPQCDSGLGRWRCAYPAEGYEPEERACDEVDNDCDGLVDEGCPCIDGAQLPCGAAVGACQAGVQECDAGVWGPCTGGVRPAEETCDATDDDCDGRTDEGLSPAQELCPDEGVCAGRPTVCADGLWQCAAEGRQEHETACDGKDNDCDGQVDEPEHLQGPEQALCPERGVCAGRANVCVEGNWRCDHPPEYELNESRCDGLDNDCDGDADELPLAQPAVRPCADTGVCGAATLRCQEGAWTCELAAEHEADVEVTCDGLDNDCDGTVDEAADGLGPLRQVCYEDADDTRGEGACADGYYLCLGDDWDRSECIDQVRPALREDCDGIDNDCDGITDERPIGEGPLARACFTGDPDNARIGACDEGIQECLGGVWEEGCDGEVLPSDEFCNGEDDDCDGVADDLPELTCGEGRCERSVPACTVGQDNLCTPAEVNARDETCDGIDDDCDGIVDNAPPVTCGDGRCEVEVVACVDGDDNDCVPDVAQIVDEVCDGVDDDCDGEVDEGELGAPLVSDCYEGPGGTEDVGFCEGGLRTCDGGDFGACAGQVLPAAEGCAAEDRDCDGQLDNGPTPALAPNGAGARAHLSPGHDFGIGDFTLEAWVMRSGDSPDLSETVLRQDGSGDTGTLALLLAGDGGTPLARVIVDGETTEVAGGQGVAAGVWTHLAVERWAGSLWLYVGGAAAGSAEIPGELRIDPQGNALQFGARSAGAERLSGAVDEVRLTRGARYRGDAFLPSERLVADARTAHLWRFSEGAGAVAADTVAAGGRNLVVEGASWRAAGVPDRRVFYSDGDGDGVGAGGAVILSCAEPPPVEDWAEVLGDCDDESDAVGAAVFEVLGNQVDDDCDGRLDDADGIRAMDLRDPGAYLSVGNARGFYLRNTDWTVEAWVKLDAYAVGAVAPLASNRYTVGQGANGWQIGVGGLGADAGNQRRLLFTLDDGAGEHTVASDRRVPLGSWTHVAVTFVEVQQLASLWINGKAAGDASLEVMPFGRTVMQIGRDHSLGDLDTHAVIDDLHFSTVLRYDAPFDPPVCAAADDDTLALWSFEEADGGASPQGAQAAREALLRGGAVRVAAACEGKAPPPASCESVIPGAAAVCRDLADGCVGRAALAGATCADWCAANGLTCDGAYVDDATCALGASIVNDCAGAAQEAICACSR